MEKNIPSKEYKLGVGEYEKTLVLYEWLTQDEEDELQRIIMGGEEISLDYDKANELKEGKGITVKLSMEKLNESNKFLFKSLCQNVQWEEFTQWNPELRREAIVLVNKIKQEIEKK